MPPMAVAGAARIDVGMAGKSSNEPIDDDSLVLMVGRSCCQLRSEAHGL